VFCPNCGFQNAETAPNCSKCNFVLKGGAPAKFKGTMLMVNQGGGSVPSGGAGQTGPQPASPSASGGPGKLKGTMVGVAPPMSEAAPGQPAATAQFGSSGVNPLGGTMVSDNRPVEAWGDPNAFNAAQAPQEGWGNPPQGGQYGAPPQGGQYGAPPQGGQYGAPPQGGQYGAPPQGGQYGAPPQGGDFGANAPGYGGQGNAWAPQQGAPGGDAWANYGAQPQQGAGAAMAPYGGGGAMEQAAGGGGGKGAVRAPMTVLLMQLIPFYNLIYLFAVCGEINGFLRRPALNAMMLILLSMVTCGLYAIFWQVTVIGKVIQEVQHRAGVQNAQNLGFMYVIPLYGPYLIQEELNKAWQQPG
jgi:hypothetical protein